MPLLNLDSSRAGETLARKIKDQEIEMGAQNNVIIVSKGNRQGIRAGGDRCRLLLEFVECVKKCPFPEGLEDDPRVCAFLLVLLALDPVELFSPTL